MSLQEAAARGAAASVALQCGARAPNTAFLGGQTLRPDATLQTAQPRLPANASLRRLGAFVRKGQPGLETLWQLEVPDLPDTFAPLRVSAPAGQGSGVGCF